MIQVSGEALLNPSLSSNFVLSRFGHISVFVAVLYGACALLKKRKHDCIVLHVMV